MVTSPIRIFQPCGQRAIGLYLKHLKHTHFATSLSHSPMAKGPQGTLFQPYGHITYGQMAIGDSFLGLWPHHLLEFSSLMAIGHNLRHLKHIHFASSLIHSPMAKGPQETLFQPYGHITYQNFLALWPQGHRTQSQTSQTHPFCHISHSQYNGQRAIGESFLGLCPSIIANQIFPSLRYINYQNFLALWPQDSILDISTQTFCLLTHSQSYV